MKKPSFLGFIVSVMAILLLHLFCSDKPTEPSHGEGINDNIAALDVLVQEPPCAETAVGEPSIDTLMIDNKRCIVKLQKYKMAAEYDEQIALDPTTDVIWPGALIDAATIPTGQYVPITVKRAPLTLSISLEQIVGVKSKTIEEPKLSTVREAIGEILSQEVAGATPARITFNIKNVYSEEQLQLAVGASYKSGFGHVKAQFDFSNSDIKTRILVKFMQVYYTIDIDIPDKPSDFFDSSVTWDDLQSQISQHTSPMYVSTITYGRMALFSFESSEESTEVNAAVSAAFSGFKTDIDASYKTTLESSTIKATIIGGSGASAVSAINGFDGIKEYILTGGDYNRDTAAAPLSYKLRHLKGNAVGNIILSSEYTIRREEIFDAIQLVDGNHDDWLAAVKENGLTWYDFLTDPVNIAMADEVDSKPGKNVDLGNLLTWRPENTPLPFTFYLKSEQEASWGGLVHAENEGGSEWVDGTISIGDIDDFEDDNFSLGVIGDSPVYAIYVYIGNNTNVTGEKVVIYAAKPDNKEEEIGRFLEPSMPHLGIISVFPLRRIFFDEDAEGDDIYVRDFYFGVRE